MGTEPNERISTVNNNINNQLLDTRTTTTTMIGDDELDTQLTKKPKLEHTDTFNSLPSPSTDTLKLEPSTSQPESQPFIHNINHNDHNNSNESEDVVDPVVHSPETLEVISNEGSPPPSRSISLSNINNNGITPKSSKQKTSRKSSPSPYSFGPKTNMTRDQVKYCGAIMRNLKKHRDAAPFIHPVDYIQLKIPDYPTVIKHPIDLTTIDNKLQRGEYNEVADFVDDIRLLFNNCYKFNGPEAMVSMLCQNVENAFEKSLRQMPPSKEASIDSPTTKEGSTSGPASFRRISEDYRPKREVHPPPSKDYPEVYQQQRRRTTTNGTSSSSPSTITGNNSNNGRRKLDVQMRFCHQALKELKKSKYRDINYPFLQPVDPVALNIPDYHTIISHPMDISTIEKNLNQGEYTSPDEFESDIKLMFNNCYRYNPPSLPVSKMAKQLEMVFDEKWKHLPEPEPTPPSPSPPPPPPPPSTSQQSHISSSSSQSSMHPSTSSKVITRKAEKYVSDDEASDNADSDSDVDDRIAELERHILTITQEIQSIKSGKKKTDRSTSKSTTKKRKPTKPSTTANKKQQQIDQPVKRRRSNKSQQQQQQQQQQRIMDELPEFTFDQKKDLSERINNLVGDKLNTVVNIIQSSMPNLDGGQEEIVLDIDALDRKTLHRLHEFVTGTSLIRKRPPPPPTSSKQNIKKRKSDNDRRIRALEESIKKFHSRKLKGRESSSESDSDSSSSSDSDDSGSSSD